MNKYYFEVLRAGINTTYQDNGRFHMQHFGVAPGGCIDLKSFFIANYEKSSKNFIYRP